MRTTRDTSWTGRLLSRLGLLAVAALVVAACGTAAGADDPPDTSETTTDTEVPTDTSETEETSADSGDPILDFYQCLRNNGLDVDDPQPGPVTGGITGVDTEDPEVQATIQDCSETHLDNTNGRVTVGEGAFEENMASPESLLAYVDCLRDEGIDMPDPTADGLLQLPEGFDTANRGGPEFQEAAQACGEHLDGGIMVGSGEGGEGGSQGVIRGDQP